ncbi:MAG TPA: c-type cytochrome [Polyangia bacterium]
MRARALVLACFVAVGCGGGPSNGSGTAGGGDPGDHGPEGAFFAGLPSGAAQLARLCARKRHDAVAARFCAAAAPPVTGIVDLEHAIGLFDAGAPPQFALTGHSTSLVEREVSSINPRAILFTAPSQPPTTQPNDGSFIADPGFVAMGFVRGSQLVEVIAHDAQANELDFYLVRFLQDCNASSSGCTPGDLLTPAVEKDWRSVTLYDDEDLKNSVLDCRHCHQPGGPSTPKMLRMQERRAPWTHWFRNNANEPGGVTLVQDFQAAHGQSEDYAGIPASLLDTPRSDPLVLEALVDNDSVSPQPNEFATAKIEQQVRQSNPAEPQSNMPMGQSATWQQIYDVAAGGSAIPVPYHDVKVTDPSKLASLSAAYRSFVDGTLPARALPDLRDVLLDGALADMGLRPRAGADGQAILQQMCQRCHNSTLDQSISRANFNVESLATMSRGQKDQAIARLTAPASSPTLMPPARFGSLSQQELQTAVDFLRR